MPSSVLAPRHQKVCRGCGVVLESKQRNHCALCGVDISRKNMIEIAKRSRIASRSAEAKAKGSAAQKQHHAARRASLPSSLPGWLTQQTYRDKIQPRLARVTVPQIAAMLGVSEPYAAKVRKGQFVPHPMHWEVSANLVGGRKTLSWKSHCTS